MSISWRSPSAEVATPEACACCLGPVEARFPVKVQRVQPAGTAALLAVGVVGTTRQTLTWMFPICFRCDLHRRRNIQSWFLAALVAVALGVVTGLSVPHVPMQRDDGPLYGFGTGFVAFPVVALLLARMLARTGPACAGRGAPVSVSPAFIGSTNVFKLKNDRWGEAFVKANTPSA